MEAVKTVADLYIPISGKVISINEELESNPEFTIALHSIGVTYQMLEQFDKALECFAKVVKIKKSNIS